MPAIKTQVFDNLYGEARLQRAHPSFVTRNRQYHRIRDGIEARNLQKTTITAIKAFHSIAFFILAGSVIYISIACAADRITRRTRYAIGLVAAEVAVILFNSGRCPLTSVVEDLGAESGSVSDIFLPRKVAENIPHVSTALLLTGITILTVRRLKNRL
jgi:hypothetical protein